ncbi:hypothetical protein [Rheinheimera sp.]|uniref:hypothetical protein n=1 Tax=Rheinheimera sp. TaxID=1869214 RepID=UPI0027347761|nr:hypothetical protein [Rheinheimera sp.]MDP2715511.1 hypothetical protein [Rheinheimera sp.]
MIVALKDFDVSFPGENAHQSLLLNKIMKKVADFAKSSVKVDQNQQALVRQAEAICELHEHTKLAYNQLNNYFVETISRYNADPDDFADQMERYSNDKIVETIEFFRAKLIQMELANTPVFESLEKFEKKAKLVRNAKISNALIVIRRHKELWFDHNVKVGEIISILNQFVECPSFPAGQSVFSRDYISALSSSGAKFLESLH